MTSVAGDPGAERFLREIGPLAPDWAQAFAAVDRAAFLPGVMWPFDMATRSSTAVDRAAQPARWHESAYADVPVTIQWDDGSHHGPAQGRVPTSSASMPSVVAGMLHALGCGPGMRVLEIGTGTGWNAGLLAHRLGGANVTSVEVDPAVAAAARRALHAAGLHPRVITADGLLGHPGHAPYDRVLATVGVRRIPPAWTAQTRPGGLVVAPWGTPFTPVDALARLTVNADGTATGPFLRPVEFMKARSQRLARAPHIAYAPAGLDGADTTTTRLTARGTGLDDPLHHPFPFTAGLLLPDCTHAAGRRGPMLSTWLYSLADLSWAAAVLHDDQPASTVYQSGPRRLWDELETAHHWWHRQGRPEIDRFGLTAGPDTDHAWLGTPDHPARL